MKNMRAKDVRLERHGEVDCWVFELFDDVGDRYFHVIPDVAVEWRSVEYDLDPNDVRAILRVLLHEVYIPDLSKRDVAEKDPALKAGMTATALDNWGEFGAGEEIPVLLNNTEDLSAVREAHLTRIAHVEANVVSFSVHEDAEEDPFEKFASQYQVDHSMVQAATQFQTEMRGKAFTKMREAANNRARTIRVDSAPDKLARYKDLFGRKEL